MDIKGNKLKNFTQKIRAVTSRFCYSSIQENNHINR